MLETEWKLQWLDIRQFHYIFRYFSLSANCN